MAVTPTNQTAGSREGRARTGFIWNLVTTFGVRAVDLLRIMIVARLLSPADFGLFSMAMVVLLGMSALGTFGLKEAFIAHRQDDDDEQERWMHAIWTGNVGIQFMLMLLLLAVAWPASLMYDEPRLFPMLLVLAAIPAMKAFNNPALMLLEKRIQFFRVAMFDLAVALIALAATTFIAWTTRSAWALVWGQIISVGLGALASYGIYRMRPRFKFDWEPIRQSLHFGKYLMAISVMTVITTQVDNLIIGLKLGAVALGLYVIAFRICEIPKLIIASTVSRTLFPYYAEIVSSGDTPLGPVWVRTFAYIMWLAAAAYVPLIVCSEFVVTLLFGQKWQPAAVLLVPLGILGILRSLNRALNPLLMAMKQTRVDATAKLVETIIFVPAILLGFELTGDVMGIAWGSVASYAVGAVWRLVWAMQTLKPGYLFFAGRMLRPLSGFLIMLVGGMAAVSAGLHPILGIMLMLLVWTLGILSAESEIRHWVVSQLRSASSRS